MDEIMKEILELARKKMRESGEYDREAFRQYIEESIDYYLEKGRLTEDDNLDLIQEQLMELHNDIEDREADE
jgi:predicted DNA-binding protein